MQNYDNWKNQSSRSAIMDALNNGGSTKMSSFGSVTDFISGLLGPNFDPNQKQVKSEEEDIEAIRFNNKENINHQNRPIPNIEDEDSHEEEDEEDEEELEDNLEDESDSAHYKIYRDKEENFECNISVQGAKLSSSQARLILDHEICNLVFYGKVSKDGKCVVPLKKMTYFPEGTIGRIRLEVIVDDTIFTPWEETFIVEGAKKVTVQIKSQKKVNLRFD